MFGFPFETLSDINDSKILIEKITKIGAVSLPVRFCLLSNSEFYDIYLKKIEFRTPSLYSISVTPYTAFKPYLSLIKKHPKLFSSFYTVPLESMSEKDFMNAFNSIKEITHPIVSTYMKEKGGYESSLI